MNADLLVKAGAAINLLDKPRKLNNMNIDFDTATTYREPAFTAQIVYEKINEILTNPRYKIGITKLSIQANAAGGRELALNTVENVYINNGFDHMVDKQLARKHKRMSCCMMNICLLFWISAFIFAVYYFVKIYE